jgi:ABC-type sugar transport system substrate-binding protein
LNFWPPVPQSFHPLSSVALFLFQRSNDYQAQLEASALSTAARLDIRVTVHDADGDAQVQLAQVLSAIRSISPPHAVLVHPVVDGVLREAAREAASRSISWVLLNREHDYVRDLRVLYPDLPIFSMAPDQTAIGRMQGRMVRHLLPTVCRLLCIDGPMTASSARLRRRGLEEILQGSRITVLHTYGDWSVDSGGQAIRHWERSLGGQASSFVPEAVVAHNDAMAKGAIAELAEVAKRRDHPELAYLPVIGCDGTPLRGLPLVQNGTLLGTVVVPPTSGPALEALYEHHRSHRYPETQLRLPVSSVPETLGPLCPDCGLALGQDHAPAGCAAFGRG